MNPATTEIWKILSSKLASQPSTIEKQTCHGDLMTALLAEHLSSYSLLGM